MTQRADAILDIAAALYANPGSPSPDSVPTIDSILRSPGLPRPTRHKAAEVLRFLLATPAGHDAAEVAFDLLPDPAAVESLQHAANWSPGLLDPAVLLGRLEADRRLLVESVIERCLYHAGDSLTAAAFDRFSQACAADPFFKYFAYYVAARPDFSPDVREKARAHVSAFRLHGQARELLGRGEKRVLAIQNIRDGQGDEIVRVVPLLQALLDFNPQLKITLVTGRCYLYGHPRLQTVPIRERARIEELLQKPFDAVIDFFERAIREVNHDPELEPLVQTAIGQTRPRLVLISTKGFNRFVFERFDVDGRPLAQELALDRQRINNIYETTFRLIAELGLPLRCGEGWPISEPVLAVAPDAEAAWEALTAGNSEHRPVALLNPFGGLEALKGYVARKTGALALEIRRLIQEGFYVVLLPNGTPWSTPALRNDTIALLQPEERKQVAIAPDPAGQSGKHADRTMQLFLSFIRLAGVIVTVEGWAMHAAYCLGRPYRVLMLPYSHPVEWHPYAATRNQCIVADPPDLPDDDTPPLPLQPRKSTLLFLLRESHSEPLLARALQSEDRDIRLAALQSPHLDLPAAGLLHFLDDRSYKIRAAAAAALLGKPAPAVPPQDHLEAYVKIAAEPRDWAAVLKFGDAARPALEAGLDDEDGVIRRESALMLRLLDFKPRSQPRRAGVRERVTKLFRRPVQNGAAAEKPAGQTVLILTPVKDGSGCIGRYCRRLTRLTYPHELISIGLLEGDSGDSSFADLERALPALREQFRRAGLWKKDFGYRVPAGIHRGAEKIQVERRTILARSRNHLLLRALDDEDWVLWLDVDVIDYPCDIIEQLLATGKDILQPHCVLDYGGPTFDRNGWRDKGTVHLDDLRGTGDLVQLDAVGATMLLVRADLHRDGLIFPAFPYGIPNAQVRSARGELETEGLGLMARDMGYQCWGMPHLEIRHRRW